jgi:hypothetical protein
MKVIKYSKKDKNDWDEFIERSKNSHFMFYRNFMEYHSNRFCDYSLLIRDSKDKLIAVLPANLSKNTLYTHEGLSFGGLCLEKKTTTNQVYEILILIINYLKKKNIIQKFVYKRIPDFYTSYPSQEDLYSLFLLNAKLTRRDISTTIDLNNPLEFNKMRVRRVNKAKKFGLVIEEINSLVGFWEILKDTLYIQHNTRPAHSLSEIESLKKNFPKNIRCFVAKKDQEILAGTLVFETRNVAHTQYLANSEFGRKVGALDLIIFTLIKKIFKKKNYFNFGISTYEEGRKLNNGLILQKEGFGGRGFIHDFYEIKIR